MKQNFLLLFLLIAINASAIISPNKKINADISVINGKATLNVTYITNGTKTVLAPTTLGIETKSQSFNADLKLGKVSKAKKIAESYDMVTGKQSHIVTKANECDYQILNSKGENLRIELRAYNDGVAFRYVLSGNGTVSSELTKYEIKDGANRWLQNFESGYEGFFPLSTNAKQGEYGYPALFEQGDNLFTLITEAGMERIHSASRLRCDNGYQVKYADNEIEYTNGWSTPWRLMIIGNAADIVESTLVTDVSPKCRLDDISWLKPSVASWVYWAYNHGSKDYKIVTSFIDLAVEMGWKYCLIDWEWEFMENGGTVEDAIKYAKDRGIKVILWYNSITSWAGNGAPGLTRPLNTPEQRKKEFTWLKEQGVAGIKVDFFTPDNKAMMNYYIDILEDAAKYHLMVDFHGCTVPRGWQRTYPNMISMEAVYGAEWYNNAPILTNAAAGHNATLPFTRNVIGPMDYTPCTFTDSQHPHITTYGHEMALPILFESGVQHMADRPSGYQNLPELAKDILKALPSTWDETHLLSGYPGKSAVIARRKGNVWFIGGINGTDQEMDITVDLSKLNVKGKTITLALDGNADRELSMKENKIGTTNIPIHMRARGGFAAMIKPL